MKKFILALLAVTSIATANAQKNSILVYGSAGFSTNNTDNGNGSESKSLNWNVNPGVGYQFTDHITVGLQGGIMSNFNENRSILAAPAQGWNRNATETREWQLGVFYRYTHNISNIFYVFGQLDLSYVSGQDITENEVRTVDFANNRIAETVTYGYDYYNGFQAMYNPVIGVMVHDGVALNFGFGGLSYRTITYDVPKAAAPLNAVQKQSGFNLTFGQQFHFGISKNFKCKTRTGNVKPGDDLRPMMTEDDDDE